LGVINLFRNSFTASATGCKIPAKEGLLGPIRLWEYPKILRSSKVINAIFTRTIIIKNRVSKRKIIVNIIPKSIPSQLQSDALR